VRNALAVRHLREMRRGDSVFVYESGRTKSIVGIARVARGPRDDPEDPRSATVRLTAVRRLVRPVGLAEIRADPRFGELALVRQSRLSVMPIPPAAAAALLGLAED
jgi:predicted RNA-binding protein with PUA-like domain